MKLEKATTGSRQGEIGARRKAGQPLDGSLKWHERKCRKIIGMNHCFQTLNATGLVFFFSSVWSCKFYCWFLALQ